MKVFCDVVRCQSFSRGAALNRISQSAASQAVHQLERHFGVQLIDRTKRPFILTAEGQVCAEGFREVIEGYESVEARIRSLRQDITGLVRVAAIYSVGLHDMSRCMQDFMAQCPKARVRLEYLRPNRVYDAVLNEDVDLGVISYPTATRGLTVIPLRTEEMVLVCRPAHRLASMEKVRVRQLNGEGFITFDRDLLIRKRLDEYLSHSNVTVEVAMEFDNIETIKQAVEIGAGISILPEPTVRSEVAGGTLVAVPLATQELRRPVGILHRQRKILTPPILKFIDLLRSAQNGTSDSQVSRPEQPQPE